jgi:RNA polymerase sigma-70 factor (ECF subfamily)
MTDTILHRVAAGDSNAVQECIERFKGLVWSLARQRLSQDDAEDAVQEIFIEIWKSAGRYDPGQASESSFIAMIARRRLIDRLRRSQRRPQTDALETKEYALPSSDHKAIEAGAEVALASRVMNTLKPQEREVLQLSVCLGMSHSEIATKTSLPLGTVKTYVRRSLQRVREALADKSLDPVRASS